MKKIYLYKVAVAFGLLTLTSCNNDLEQINIDPNKTTEVPTTGLFTNANKDMIEFTRGGFSSGRMALPWVQYSAQRNYTPEDRYQYRTDVNKSLYTQIWLTVKNYKTIIDICENPEKRAQVLSWGDLDNQIAAARIMIAYAQLQLVDTYGDIPYYSYGSDDPDFQAMRLGTDKEISTPVFASQEKIYKDLMKELKEASESINVNATVFVSGDQIFGNAQKMKRFANSLRLKIAVRVQSVIPEAKVIIEELVNGGELMQSNDDSVTLQFQNDRIKPAPMYKLAFMQNRNDFSPTNTFVELLKGEGKAKSLGYGVDPRLFKMVAPTTNLVERIDANGDSELVEATVSFRQRASNPNFPSIEAGTYQIRDASFYVGMPIGIPDEMTASQAGVSSQYSHAVYKPDYKMVFMEYSEVEFLISEAKGFDNGHYQKGVKASMDTWGVSSSDADAFIATLPLANKEHVLTQKYIALYMIPYEAWAEYRRTGFPKTLLLPGEEHKLNAPYGSNKVTSYTFESLVTDVKSDLPERIGYSVDLDLVNKANKDAAAARMGGDKMSTPLIWSRNHN